MMEMMKMESLACSHQDIENGNKLFNIMNVLAQTILTIKKEQFAKRVINQKCFMEKVVRPWVHPWAVLLLSSASSLVKWHESVILIG